MLLRTVTRTQGNNAALKDGTVAPAGFELAFEDVPVLVDAFRRMVRGLEFDVCEMAATTYLCARSFGVPFTALPIFLVRAFHHGAITVNRNAGILHPKDLEGRRVGVSRGYTVTTGVWARGILATEYGVDLDSVTWVRSGDEHVAEYRPPANVASLEPGRTLTSSLMAGELDAVIGEKVEHPDAASLIPDPVDAGYAALRSRGHYPINHLVVVRDDVLEAHPGLAAALVDAFSEAKAIYVSRLRNGLIDNPTSADATYARVMRIIDGDPLPYGVEPNRAVLEELIGHAVSQHILDSAPSVESLFACA
jgi:4,5-dihydroxyphthalate decarboxylase